MCRRRRLLTVRADAEEAADHCSAFDRDAGGIDIAGQPAGLANSNSASSADVATNLSFDGEIPGDDRREELTSAFDDDVAARGQFTNRFVACYPVVLEDESLAAMGAEDGHGTPPDFGVATTVRADDDLRYGFGFLRPERHVLLIPDGYARANALARRAGAGATTSSCRLRPAARPWSYRLGR